MHSSIETVRWAEGGVGLCGLFGIVGGGVAAEHGRGRVSEEELEVDLAGLLFDGPGSEGMAEAVRVDLGDGGLLAEALEDGAHGGATEGAAAAYRLVEGSWESHFPDRPEIFNMALLDRYDAFLILITAPPSCGMPIAP